MNLITPSSVLQVESLPSTQNLCFYLFLNVQACINILLAVASAAKLSFPWKLPGRINSEIITLKTFTSTTRKQNPTTQVFLTALYLTIPAAIQLRVLHQSSIFWNHLQTSVSGILLMGLETNMWLPHECCNRAAVTPEAIPFPPTLMPAYTNTNSMLLFGLSWFWTIHWPNVAYSNTKITCKATVNML